MSRLSLPRPMREAEEFAALLERPSVPATHPLAPLALLARGLEPSEVRPSAGFRTSLRQRLVAEAAARPSLVPAPRPALESQASTTGPRLRHAVAALTAMSLVTGLGTAAASTRALPGDALYDLKRQLEAAQLALAFGDLAEGRELLEQAQARLDEAARIAAAEGPADPEAVAQVRDLLVDWGAAAAAGASELTDAYRASGDPEPVLLLDRFVADQQEQLEDLLALLDPALRARVRAALDALKALATSTQALLAATGRPAASASHGSAPAAAEMDGWAVGALVDKAELLAATGSGGAGGGEVSSGSGAGVDGALADTVGDTVGSASSTGTGSSSDGGASTGSTGTVGSIGDLLDPVGDGSSGSTSTSSDPLPLPPLPLPTVSSEPTVSGPVPEPTLSTEPLPSLSVSISSCVPLPPLTSCP